jgi:hypothetical protein
MGVLQGLMSLTVNGRQQLFAAWKGEPGDNRIFYSWWNGSGAWQPPETIPGNSSVGPSLAIYKDTLYAAWKGEWSDPRVFFSYWNGQSWEPQQPIPNIYSDAGPALCQYGNSLIAAWKSVFDQNIYYATYDGHTWSAQTQIQGASTTFGPSLAYFGRKLYAAWMVADSNSTLWYSIYDETRRGTQPKWDTPKQIPAVGSSGTPATTIGPSLAVAFDNLYAVWQSGDGESLWYATWNGTEWSGQTQLTLPSGILVGPAAAAFNGNLYAMWAGSSEGLNLIEFNNTSWQPVPETIPGNTGPEPTRGDLPTPMGGEWNYMFSDSAGANLSGATVSIIVAENIVAENGGDYSFQINCVGPAQASGPEAFVEQQYCFDVTQDEVVLRICCFREQDTATETPLINWDSRPPRLPSGQGTVPVPNNLLTTGYQLTLTLLNNAAGAVEAFFFSMVQPNGTALNSPAITLESLNSSVTSQNLAPIVSYQAILVGKQGGATTNFSAGKGLFQFYENDNLVAGMNQIESLESSNIVYGLLPGSYPNGEFYQTFGIGIDLFP